MTSNSDRKKQEELKELRKKYRESRSLLVEGSDDLYVTAAIRDRFKLEQNFWIEDCKGYDGVTRELDFTLQKENFERLGIVVDADSDISQRWKEIRKVFSVYSVNLPNSPEPNGTIYTHGTKKIGVWLMPDNQHAGILEDLYQTFIPESDALVPFVNQSLDTIESRKVHRYNSRIKAFVHTWLAWQEDSGMPMGRAISDYNLVDTTTAEQFAEWLKNLFT